MRICEQHVSALLAEPPSLRTVQRMDEVSNLLCSVIDVAEMCKSIHPLPEWRDAAAATSAQLVDYMTTLNHHRGIRDAMANVLALPEFPQFTPEAQRVATTLKEEMDATGVAAEKHVREALATLLQEVHTQTHAYMSAVQADVSEQGTLPEDELPDGGGAPPEPLPFLMLSAPRTVLTAALSKLPSDWRRIISIHGNGTQARAPHEAADALLRHLPYEALRKQVYLQHHSLSLLRVPARSMERVMHARQLFARTLSLPSYAHFQVGRCVAKEPEHVEKLLTGILDTLQPTASTQGGNAAGASDGLNNPKTLEERRMFQASKLLSQEPDVEAKFPSHAEAIQWVRQSRGGDVDAVELRPWDVEFLHARVRSAVVSPELAHALSHYFTVGNVLRGYTLLLQRLFGIEVRLVAPTPEEDWTAQTSGRLKDELIKLELWEDEGNHMADGTGQTGGADSDSAPPKKEKKKERVLLGVMYLDLFARPNKFHNAAAFNFRSSRRVFFHVEGEGETAVPVDSAAGEERQIPVAGIVAVMQRPSVTARSVSSTGGVHPRQLAHAPAVALLSLADTEMLFHELGHCLHNVLSRTSFQHVAGARGELDYVELPSTLFENFVTSDVAFVRQWARHFQTDDPMPLALHAELIKAKSAFRNSDLASSAAQALFDQRMHGRVMLELQAGAGVAVEGEIKYGQMLRIMQPLWEDVQRRYALFRPPQTTTAEGEGAADPLSNPMPFVRMIHLLAYGANYYCYTYCRLFATLLWRDMFAPHTAAAAATTSATTTDERERAVAVAGRRLRSLLFAQGGAKDPEQILRQLARVDPATPLPRFVEQQLAAFVRADDQAATAAAGVTDEAGNDVIAGQEAQARLHSEAATHAPKQGA